MSSVPEVGKPAFIVSSFFCIIIIIHVKMMLLQLAFKMVGCYRILNAIVQPVSLVLPMISTVLSNEAISDFSMVSCKLNMPHHRKFGHFIMTL